MFDVAFAHDIRKEPKKDIINNSTNISPLRLHQSMKLKISTHFQMAEKTHVILGYVNTCLRVIVNKYVHML